MGFYSLANILNAHGLSTMNVPVQALLPNNLKLNNSLDRGVVTGAQAIHWPCLGANVIACAEQNLSFAVADHGLESWQREELERIGVIWLKHNQPEIKVVPSQLRPVSGLYAWWKPWVCAVSPFAESIWVDSDAVITGDLGSCFAKLAEGDWVSTARLWGSNEVLLYTNILHYVYGKLYVKDLNPNLYKINTGFLGWRKNSRNIAEWCALAQALLSDAEALKFCGVRDQTAFFLLLVKRYHFEHTYEPMLIWDNNWNYPADGLPISIASMRQPISLNPYEMLQQAKQRHPGTIIVHWLGRPKPWEIRPRREYLDKIRPEDIGTFDPK